MRLIYMYVFVIYACVLYVEWINLKNRFMSLP